MTISLFTSLALALTWTPNLSLYFIGRSRKEPKASQGAESEEESTSHLLEGRRSTPKRFFRRLSLSMSAGCDAHSPGRCGLRS